MNTNNLSIKERRAIKIQERNKEIKEFYIKKYKEGYRTNIIFKEISDIYLISFHQLRRLLKVNILNKKLWMENCE